MKIGSEKSMATTPRKSRFDNQVDTPKNFEASGIYDTLIRQERRRAYVGAFLINAFLGFYMAFGVYFLASDFQGLEMSSEVLGFFFPLSLIFSYFWSRSPHSIGRSIIERTNPVLKSLRTPQSPDSQFLRAFTKIITGFLLIETAVLGWVITEMDMYALLSYEGLQGARRIFVSIFTPEWSILGMVMTTMIQTIFIALMATLIAIPVAFVGSFFCARNLMKNSKTGLLFYNILRVIFNFTRSVEPLIWAIIFSVWVGIGPFAGMLALMLHSVAGLAKLYSEQIESIDRGPMEAIEATGANPIQVVWYAVVPQIILPYLSFTIYRWDINIRMATIIGLVGGGGVGTLLMQYQGLAKWHHVGTIVIVIAIVVWIMDYLSAKLREAIY